MYVYLPFVVGAAIVLAIIFLDPAKILLFLGVTKMKQAVE